MRAIHHFLQLQRQPIKSFFDEQFAIESLNREKMRAKALFLLFALGFVVLCFIYVVPEINTFPLKRKTQGILIFFLAGLALYEGVLLRFISYRLKIKADLPRAGKYMNAFVEVSHVSLLLYVLSRDFTIPITTLLTPAAMIYFYFIILSTLRLNFALSVFTAFSAAAQYLLLSVVFLEVPFSHYLDPFFQNPFVYLSKSAIILLSGVAAGYVATQIKSSIKSSIESLEAQNQVITLFGQQISREVVEVMLKQNGMLVSKLMRVCILFLDIRNFTTYAEKKSPEEVVAYQNAFFSIIIEIINRNHGIINQFLGDGCMVTFGAPLILNNPCENAVNAGLEIIERLKQACQLGNIPPTSVGIGIHVGDAVTGNIGTDLRQQYSITGNVVILASRIEQLNKDFNSQMLVSKEVLECLNDEKLQAESLGKVNVKGREEPVELYKLA